MLKYANRLFPLIPSVSVSVGTSFPKNSNRGYQIFLFWNVNYERGCMFQHFLAPTLLWTQRESLLMILTRFENKRLTPKVTFSFFWGGQSSGGWCWKNHGRPWPCEREGPAPQEWEGSSFSNITLRTICIVSKIWNRPFWVGFSAILSEDGL